MCGIDFSKYPVVDDMIHDCEMEQERDHIVWLRLSQADTAVALAEMHLLCKAALSNSIPLRNRSRLGANYYHSTVNNKIHIFASHQALTDLGMTEKDLAKLFAHKQPG